MDANEKKFLWLYKKESRCAEVWSKNINNEWWNEEVLQVDKSEKDALLVVKCTKSWW